MSDAIELIKTMHAENERLRASNASLVEALRPFAEAKFRDELKVDDFNKARAEIAKAKGE